MATVYEFNYTGSEQSITLKPGEYKLECWGASGGRYHASSFTECAKGGYVKGDITLKEQTKLYVYVGQSGFERYSSPSGSGTRTGFNGGGKGSSLGNSSGRWSTIGGGATDIRLVGGSWDNTQNLLSRILVAGGGGGSESDATDPNDVNEVGGAGGGLEGNRGYGYSLAFSGGGTQFYGGQSRVDDYDGSFGKGGKGATNGGGGGWFGGAGDTHYSGGGGSGYALTKDSYKPQGYVPTSKYWLQNVVMTTGGNTTKGDGYAKITLLQALPLLTISSYSSTQATFKADHTDATLLTKIEWFIDDILKETITTDLTTEKTINYTLEDNALHTLKIVVTDSANATAEKVVSISKNIMPLGDDASLQDIASKVSEMKDGLINGKTSIINVLALKNIESSLNNTLVELSEKIKKSFNSSDASLQDLINKLTQANNTISQLNSKYKYASGTTTVLMDTKGGTNIYGVKDKYKYKSYDSWVKVSGLGFVPNIFITISKVDNTTSTSYYHFYFTLSCVDVFDVDFAIVGTLSFRQEPGYTDYSATCNVLDINVLDLRVDSNNIYLPAYTRSEYQNQKLRNWHAIKFK